MTHSKCELDTPAISRLLKNNFWWKKHAKTPMILRFNFSKHAFFNSLLAREVPTKNKRRNR